MMSDQITSPGYGRRNQPSSFEGIATKPHRIQFDVSLGTPYRGSRDSILRQAWESAGIQLRDAIAPGITPETLSRSMRRTSGASNGIAGGQGTATGFKPAGPKLDHAEALAGERASRIVPAPHPSGDGRTVMEINATSTFTHAPTHGNDAQRGSSTQLLSSSSNRRSRILAPNNDNDELTANDEVLTNMR